MNQVLFDAAISYVEAGLSVLPCSKSEKRPMVSWKQYQNTAPALPQVRLWFGRLNVTGIGIITGHGLEVIDFDAAGKYYSAYVKAVKEIAPELMDKLLVEETQSGGNHIAYVCREINAPNMELAKEEFEVDGPGEHELFGKTAMSREIEGKFVCPVTTIETRGAGGLIVCSPTPGYNVIQGRLTDIPVITLEERELLIRIARSFNKYVELSKIIDVPQGQKVQEAKNMGLSPAEDYNLRGEIKELLRKHGYTELNNGQWRRPGKNHGQSASLLNDEKVFYCFSTNMYPFEAGRGYSKFAVYTLLEHDGDYHKAALALLDQGFATPLSKNDVAEVNLDSYLDTMPETKEVESQLDQAESGAVLEFPDIYAGVAGDFAETFSSYLESPKHFFYIAFLTCLGNVLAGRVSLSSEISPDCRLYTLILGESADDRKSTALDKATNFFNKMISTGGFLMCHGVGSAEGLAQKIVDGEGLLLVFDELKSFIGKCKIDSSVLLPCVNTLFEANRFESKTKKGEINIQNGYLSILAASTLQTYERCWDPQFTDIGFNNRLFLVPGKGQRRFAFPAKIPISKINRLKQDLSKVLAFIGKDGYEFEITEEARKAYEKWYLELTPSVHTKRLDSYAMRFMQLLAINEMKDNIDLDIVEKVVKLMNWQWAVRKIHDPIDADSKIAIMEEKIRRQVSKTGIKERNLKQLVNANRAGLWVFQSALKNLENAKEIRWDKANKRWVS